MRSTIIATLTVATAINLAIIGAVHAQTAKQQEANAKAVAKAEQSLVMSQCKLDWLRDHAGASRTSPAYFTFMAECLTKTASK
jgi:hypothetical protein